MISLQAAPPKETIIDQEEAAKAKFGFENNDSIKVSLGRKSFIISFYPKSNWHGIQNS